MNMFSNRSTQKTVCDESTSLETYVSRVQVQFCSIFYSCCVRMGDGTGLKETFGQDSISLGPRQRNKKKDRAVYTTTSTKSMSFPTHKLVFTKRVTMRTLESMKV